MLEMLSRARTLLIGPNYSAETTILFTNSLFFYWPSSSEITLPNEFPTMIISFNFYEIFYSLLNTVPEQKKCVNYSET